MGVIINNMTIDLYGMYSSKGDDITEMLFIKACITVEKIYCDIVLNLLQL